MQEIQNSDVMCTVKLLVGINNPCENQNTCHTPTSLEPRVSRIRAENFAHSHDMQYCEVDINTKSTIVACFAKIVEQMIGTRQSNKPGVHDSLRLEETQKKQPESSCC